MHGPDPLRRGAFSAWIRDVIGDEPLATRLRGVERWYQTEESADLEVGRHAVLRAIEERYGGEELDARHRYDRSRARAT